jgi:hypothetical protein
MKTEEKNQQFNELFLKTIAPDIVKRYGKKDYTALRTAWNEWTDGLCKSGEITFDEYEDWIGPSIDDYIDEFGR